MNAQIENSELQNVAQAGASDRDSAVKAAPSSAGANLAADAAQNGGTFEDTGEYQGSVGRTTFDDRSSVDGTVAIVLPATNVDLMPSQSLIRITSVPDRREYIASVTAGPFNEPDGLRADSPALIASAVHGARTMPRHHGRVRATVLGLRIDGSLVPARHRPKPNSPVHTVSDTEMSSILNLGGDVRLGLVYGHDTVEVRIPSDDKSELPRHTAMVGTTGSGKSSGNGRYISGLQSANRCVVLFDVEGEYGAINEETDNQQLRAALRDRGLTPAGIPNTHLYYLTGRDCSNPSHPNKQEFCLRFDGISPYAFTEIMDLSQAQEDRLLRVYESAKLLMRQLKIYPRPGHEKHDEAQILDVDEFERGWPCMTLDHLMYLVSGEINLAEGTDLEPSINAVGFTGRWPEIRTHLFGRFSSGSDEGDRSEKKRGKAPSFGDQRSYKVLAARIARIRRLGIFDRGNQHLNYVTMLQPGRVNVIDLSDLDSGFATDIPRARLLELNRMQSPKFRFFTSHRATNQEVGLQLRQIQIEGWPCVIDVH